MIELPEALEGLKKFQQKHKQTIELFIRKVQGNSIPPGVNFLENGYENLVIAEYLQKVEQVERLTRKANKEYLSTLQITRKVNVLPRRTRESAKMEATIA